jgi:hypothetical protein
MRKIRPAGIITLLILPGVLFALSACYKNYGLTIDEYDTVATIQGDITDYTPFQEYYLEETIADLDDPDNPSPEQPANKATILSSIRSKMTEFGYTEVAQGTTEAAIIQLAYSETSYFYYYYYNYCYYGYCWYYPPGWGGYTYAYTAGSLFIQMGDVRTAVPGVDEIPAIWHAGLNGILDDTSVNLTDRLERGIDQAFDQSPYLNIN